MLKQDYDSEKLKKAQEASLRILLSVDGICRRHGLSCMMDSGTLLGAVRHKGFIPWDDDVDIAMTRDSFERFICVAREELPDSMQLVLPWELQNGKAFYDFVPRIVYLPSKRHTSGEETEYYEGKLNHLWVDIFILDNIPDGRATAALTRFRQKCIYGLSMPGRFSIDFSRYSFWDKAKVGFLGALSVWFPLPGLFVRQRRLSVRYNGIKTSHVYYSNYQPDFIQVTLEREWIENTVELEFEGHMFMAPAGWDKVLGEIYGDYMTLPPEEKRRPSHSDDIEVTDESDQSYSIGI